MRSRKKHTLPTAQLPRVRSHSRGFKNQSLWLLKGKPDFILSPTSILISLSLTQKRKNLLIKQACVVNRKASWKPKIFLQIASAFRAKIVPKLSASNRVKLWKHKFWKKWVAKFVARYQDSFSLHISCTVDKKRFLAFKAFNIGNMFLHKCILRCSHSKSGTDAKLLI